MAYRFARLTQQDEPSIALHLLALDVEDRFLRFGHPAPDATLAAYARQLNFNRDVAEGAWDSGSLIGFAHLAVYPENGFAVGELGVSVRPEGRGKGIASRLIQQALARAERYGLTKLTIHFMRRNLGMTRLAARFASNIGFDGDEGEAVIAVRAGPNTVYTEVHRAGPNGRLEVFKRIPAGLPRGHVLLVHGAGGDGWQWRRILAALATEGYAAHAVSLSGHGTSEAAEPRLERLAEDLREVLHGLPDDTCLVGHSLGGYLVQHELTANTRPAAVLLAPVPPDVPRDQDLALMLAGLEGVHAREFAAKVMREAAPIVVERVKTPITLISGDADRVMPIPWMRRTAHRYRAPWTRLPVGHNLPIANGVTGPLVAGLVRRRA